MFPPSGFDISWYLPILSKYHNKSIYYEWTRICFYGAIFVSALANLGVDSCEGGWSFLQKL